VPFDDATSFVAAGHEGSTETLMGWDGTRLSPIDHTSGDALVAVAVY
jgi:hypothetical protein